MPQIFQVLKCYKCSVFQVHQTKKSNKFACKMCGEKQSIKRHYGVGTGQECRVHVQNLNSIRGDILDAQPSAKDLPETDKENGLSATEEQQDAHKHSSKWVEYVNDEDSTHGNESHDDKMFLEDKEVILELPNRKHPRKSFNRYKKKSKKDEYKETNDEYNCLNKNDLDNINKTVPHSYSKYNLDNRISDNNHSLNMNCNNNQDTEYNQKVKKPFVPSLAVKKSKWVKFDHDSRNDCSTELQENDNTSSDKSSKHNIIAHQIDYEKHSNNKYQIIIKESSNGAVIKKSKWTDFIEESCNDNRPSQDNKSQVECSSQKHHPNLFNLCDDKEIDEFLDI